MLDGIKCSNKIVYLPDSDKDPLAFRSNDGLPDHVLKKLKIKGRKYGIQSILPFDVKEIIVAQWVNLKCRYGCTQFNSNWSCPPATPNISETRSILKEYSTALLLIGSRQCKDFYKKTSKNRTDQVRYWKGSVILERELFLEGYDKAFSLVSGACSLCKKCAYPDNCRFPMEKRPTVESFSIDVIGTLKNLGINTHVAMNINETFNYYSMILLD